MFKRLVFISLIYAYTISNGIFVSAVSDEYIEHPWEALHLVSGDISGVAQGFRNSWWGGGAPMSPRWPDNTIPYMFSPGYPNYLKRIFHQAIRHISQKTCFKFVPRTNQRDYIYIINDNTGCYSNLGRVGGPQKMSLPTKHHCARMSTHVHEILHAIGLPHEHSRLDRDRTVRINWQNVQPGAEKDFGKVKGADMQTRYDLGSVMQYGRTAGSRNGGETITPLRSYPRKLGNEYGLSRGDVQELNKMFCKGNQG